MNEPLIPPTAKYTGTEVCAKCGAPAAQVTTGYDADRGWVMLQCQKCTCSCYVLPLDTAP
jgi:hypothetical protein